MRFYEFWALLKQRKLKSEECEEIYKIKKNLNRKCTVVNSVDGNVNDHSEK
jgi:hypothetical protein